jgi:hypothetical protein
LPVTDFPLLGDRFLYRHAATKRYLELAEIERAESIVVEHRVEQGVDASESP